MSATKTTTQHNSSYPIARDGGDEVVAGHGSRFNTNACGAYPKDATYTYTNTSARESKLNPKFATSSRTAPDISTIKIEAKDLALMGLAAGGKLGM